ncbi:MAG: ATP synthase F1 subunit gamma [Holosporaceae bacterium]|jgi:F-type H+-transporting ATPase subunit gamma|nr:ATP synthase F1 subunit gamma [Holosporaceae bacterium]
MANLKELRNKIGTIQSIRKVTSAMKLVAGVKLKKAELRVNTSREYAEALADALSGLRREFLETSYPLLEERKRINTHLLLVLACDRGLCGNFNHLVCSQTAEIVAKLHGQKRRVHLLCVGARPFELLKHFLREDDSIELVRDFFRGDQLLSNSRRLAKRAIADFESGKVDAVSIVYTKFYTVIRHDVQIQDLIPAQLSSKPDRAIAIFEPNEGEILSEAVPHSIASRIYQCVCESVASEQSMRMTSMDNATRNAEDLLSDLTLKYNRLRQYKITQELAEVVSGAESVSKG